MIYNLRICEWSILTYWKMVIKNQSCSGIFSLKRSLSCLWSHQSVMTTLSPSPSMGTVRECWQQMTRILSDFCGQSYYLPKHSRYGAPALGGWVGGHWAPCPRWNPWPWHHVSWGVDACCSAHTQKRPLATGFFEHCSCAELTTIVNHTKVLVWFCAPTESILHSIGNWMWIWEDLQDFDLKSELNLEAALPAWKAVLVFQWEPGKAGCGNALWMGRLATFCPWGGPSVLAGNLLGDELSI